MVTKITNTFDEEEISKLSIGEKIQKGYYEVINEEEWQNDMRAKHDNMSEKCERLQKQLDIAVAGLQYYANEDIYIECHKVVNGNNEWKSEVMLDNGVKASYFLKKLRRRTSSGPCSPPRPTGGKKKKGGHKVRPYRC